ncbi:MAG: hypothetical protein FWG18_03540 [Alphaproteobacteria bacterium]|nr:hypothetical protein [Alphaproteobacteria bacterium]
MSEILDLIFKELDGLEESTGKLRGRAAASGKQIDLEVAILTQQVADLRGKNAAAAEKIDSAVKILEKLKK